jgi:transcriptional regulator with XRE-family HTH domain
MARNPKPTADAIEILHRRYFEGKPDMLARLQAARLNAKIAQQIYDLRVKAGLTQRQLAEQVGTTASVICRLEDADYEGHSLLMLQRIAAVLGKQVEIRFAQAVAAEAPAAGDRGKSKTKRRSARQKRNNRKLKEAAKA